MTIPVIRTDEGYVHFVDPSRLEDPMFWFMKAHHFSSAATFLQNALLKAGEHAEPELKFNAINAVPYLAVTAAELFMKGYLVSKGEPGQKMKDYHHNLKNLRERCLSYQDIRFSDKQLSLVTDSFGPHLTEDGGIRYPDKSYVPGDLDLFQKVLTLLSIITSEVEDTLSK